MRRGLLRSFSSSWVLENLCYFYYLCLPEVLLGGTITFALFSPTFPCNNVGKYTSHMQKTKRSFSSKDPQMTVKNATSAVIVGGWTLSGLRELSPS